MNDNQWVWDETKSKILNTKGFRTFALQMWLHVFHTTKFESILSRVSNYCSSFSSIWILKFFWGFANWVSNLFIAACTRMSVLFVLSLLSFSEHFVPSWFPRTFNPEKYVAQNEFSFWRCSLKSLDFKMI